MTALPAAALPPAIVRLAGLAPLSAEDVAELQSAAKDSRRVSARRELLAEGSPLLDPMILLSGWACRIHQLNDGRRQIVSLILPGELIGMCRHKQPVSSTAVMALTDVSWCVAPPAAAGCDGTGLGEAYAVSLALDEVYLMRNITRLGRLSAYERTADWLLEMRERLARCGLATNSFPMPLTQEMLADALGLTSVHVNRTLQAMRRDGSVTLHGGIVTLSDPERLGSLVDHRPARVTIR